MNIKKVKLIKRKTNSEQKEFKKKIKKLGKTFLSKFIIHLTSKVTIPEFYLYILKYEHCNRTKEDINRTLPFFQTLDSFNEYINLKEKNSSKILINLAWLSFYSYKKKHSIIKRPNEDNNIFYLILNGNIAKLNLIFKKEKISMEEYLLYLLKMKLLQENHIINKCNKLNSEIIKIDINNFKNYTDNNIIYNYRELKNRAKQELKEEGFIFTGDNNFIIPSVEYYVKLNNFSKYERNNTQTRYNLYLGNYIKSNSLSNGSYIGDLSKNENGEGYSYICTKNSDICYINKTETIKNELYDYVQLKILNIFKEVKHKFYILKDTPDNFCVNYLVPFMIYKTYKKGDKIIIQNSQYEGIYFIINGKIKVSVSQTHNELSNTLISLQYSIFNFKEYVSKIIKTIDILNEFNLNYILNNHSKNIVNLKENETNNDIFSTNEYLSYFKGTYNIDFYTLKDGDILGLNELYDYKTELYNFNAECVSDDARLFFVSKRNFNNVMKKDNNIMNNVIELIDFKAKALIGKINLYRNFYKSQIIQKLKNKQKNAKKISNSCMNLKVNNYINTKNNKEEVNNNNIVQFKRKEPKIFDNLKINFQNKIGLFKNNKLLKYLKNSNFFDSITNYEIDNNIINNDKTLTNKDKYAKKHKILKSKSVIEQYNLKNNKKIKNYTSINFYNSNDSNSNREKFEKKLYSNDLKSRNKNNINKTIYCINKKQYISNNNSEQKDLENVIKNNYSIYSNLPLIKEKKIKLRKISTAKIK